MGVYTPPSLSYEGNSRVKREASTHTGKNPLHAKQRPPKLTHVAAYICGALVLVLRAVERGVYYIWSVLALVYG